MKNVSPIFLFLFDFRFSFSTGLIFDPPGNPDFKNQIIKTVIKQGKHIFRTNNIHEQKMIYTLFTIYIIFISSVLLIGLEIYLLCEMSN